MTALGRLRPTLINPTYTRLWFGQAVSSVGDAVFSTTLVLWVATVLAEGKSWGPQAVSGVVLATSAAVMFVGPFAGVFVDRWDKRATMLGTEVLRGGLVAVLTAVAFVPTRELPAGVWLALIYVMVLVLNAAGQFFTPARFSIIAELVTDEADRARAAGIAQATGQTAWIIGPPLAAPLLFAVGLQWALLFNALSYLVSYVAISTADLRPVHPARSGPAAPRNGKAAERPGLFKDFTAGLRFFAHNRFLVALLLLTVIGQLGMGALSTLNIFFATRNLHVSAESYGYLGMALGIGGIAGALAAGRVVQWIGARRTTWIGLIASGALLVLYSRQTGFPAAVTLLFVFVVPITMLNTAMAPLLLAATPQEFRGRVISVFYPVTRLAAMLTAVLSGWLAGSGLRDFSGSVAGLRFGPIDTIFAVSGLVVVLAGVYARVGLPASGTAPAAGPGPAAAVPDEPVPDEPAPLAAGPDAEPAREPVAMAVEAHGEVPGEASADAPASPADSTDPADRADPTDRADPGEAVGPAPEERS
ncbi:Na+/melibiose symporter [Streptomyces sp. TLI_053]|uniref:MFS transporter n=1 Tax=Streptomyces sp. TLI_053 TaxID=1855352 RepID=UPI00087CE8FC|nr:MFS transporter [Streptomyces sp. TLI_053]SDT82032.1 Na+/melibiose symporter [Streptomyces sp. TLI_053]